jgi:hypothetical protein
MYRVAVWWWCWNYEKCRVRGVKVCEKADEIKGSFTVISIYTSFHSFFHSRDTISVNYSIHAFPEPTFFLAHMLQLLFHIRNFT